MQTERSSQCEAGLIEKLSVGAFAGSQIKLLAAPGCSRLPRATLGCSGLLRVGSQLPAASNSHALTASCHLPAMAAASSQQPLPAASSQLPAAHTPPQPAATWHLPAMAAASSLPAEAARAH